MRPQLKAAYDDFTEESDATGLECKDETLTQQNQEADANINNIVRKYTQTGEIPIHNRPPLVEDFALVQNFQDAMNLIVESKATFMEQPADVRNRFNNDPAQFVEFCSNEENRADMRKMGLLSQAEHDRYQAAQAALEKAAADDKTAAEAFRKAQDKPKS